jgi:hypothetical protein
MIRARMEQKEKERKNGRSQWENIRILANNDNEQKIKINNSMQLNVYIYTAFNSI